MNVIFLTYKEAQRTLRETIWDFPMRDVILIFNEAWNFLTSVIDSLIQYKEEVIPLAME